MPVCVLFQFSKETSAPWFSTQFVIRNGTSLIMAKLISLSAVILGCILLVRAEPPVTSYSISGDNNGYEYNTNIIKDGHRETTDFYAGGNNAHSLTNSRSQGNLEESLRSNTYSGFSPSSHGNGFQGFSSSARENLGTSSYFINDPAQSPFEGYTNSKSNGDSGFDGYTQGSDQTGSDYSQFSSKHKSPTYMRFSDNLPGASNAGSFSDLVTEGSTFRDYSGDAYRGHAPAGYVDSDQAINREPSNLFNNPGSDYTYGKPKEGIFGIGSGNKYTTDAFSAHPDTRYLRGNHGNMGREYASPTYLSSSASSPFSGVRATSSGLYSSGKFNKYNKYVGDYAPNAAGLNYLSKDQGSEAEHLFGNYGKGSGKVAAFKDGRPSSYSSPAYLGGPSYLNKIAASYKSKPSFMNYPSSSPVGYSSMSSLHSSLNGNSYTDGSMLRRYRSSSGYVPGHGSIYSGYY